MNLVKQTRKNQVIVKYVVRKPRRINIFIKNNNMIIDENCPICGKYHQDSSMPNWVFPEDSGGGLCQECAERYCPDFFQQCVHEQELFRLNYNKGINDDELEN
jgi:hypothetical protein